MTYKIWMMIGVLGVLLTAVSLPAFTQSEPAANIETITIEPNTNQLQTPTPIEAPFAFNAVVPSWVADGEMPDLEIRTSPDGQRWSDWVHIHAHEDWTLPEDSETSGDMIVVPDIDGTHQFIQYQIHQNADGGELATLAFTFINSIEGPTTSDLLTEQQTADTARPPVFSRDLWCIYDTCDDTDDLYYEPVTHLIVHHTVSSNTSANWAATVRAIYLYHRDTKGWGDIGYNYLIDPDGIIYEGHMNEDYELMDVVGTHASAANEGGFGTALLGTFTSLEDNYSPGGVPFVAVPPEPMLNSLVDLFAWKVEQRGIEVYDASRMVNMSWGLPHIMGHRDVYGGTNTICPGGSVHDLLPWLREEVANQLGQLSPFTFVSEESSAFTKSNANWYEGPHGCGWQGHSYYTWTTMDPTQSTNWGEWEIAVPATGLYEIQVYAPYCNTGNAETEGASYQIDNGATVETAVVSHQENVGLWMSLGNYQLNAGNNSLRLTDLTTTDIGVGIWFDDIRFKPVLDVVVAPVSPAQDSWLTEPTVPFSWTIDNPSLVQTLTLEVATDEVFTDMVHEMSWTTAVTTTTHTFAQDYQDLYWRISADTGGATVSSEPSHFSLDSTAPESSITSLTHHAFAGIFDITWEGSDATAGIAGYNIDYKIDGAADWTRWLTNTTQINGSLMLPHEATDLIWFRSQAIDHVGNIEAESNGDMHSDEATVIFNPSVQNTRPVSTWYHIPVMIFNWSLTEISEVTNNTLEVASDEAFTNVIVTYQTLITSTSHVSLPTTQQGMYYWRVTTEFTPPLLGLTRTVTSEPTWYGYDRLPPTSTVTAVYTITNDLYMIATTGVDSLAGIDQINVAYQAEGDVDWIPLPYGSAFMPPDPTQVYYFRSQAIDRAGNIEPAHATADMDTNQAKPIPHAIMLPVITK